ncbi:MAG: hypothetical protein GY854_23895, partial [Deltaproteobacteria bacterium]|nr:hypothetical protein [Deltaproteobacteria bacterium]
MEKLNTRSLGYLTLSVIIVTIIWLITFIIGEASAPPINSLEDKIAAVESQMPLFLTTYINAALLTVLCVFMFAGFYIYCRPRDELWSTVAFS